MNAYTYFKNMSLSVEPDMPVEAAGEKEESAKDTEEIIVSKDALTVSETENPIDTLNNIMSDTSDSEEITVSQDGNVTALIDTGVGESANVIDRVSVIEEPEASTEHGDAMLQAIVSQNPDAKILSIRAMNSNGFGTISSLVAAMEYAISENVDMINLSLYARTTLSTSVLKSEIQKAVDAGITVIGAAGNDGVDVVDYVPGSVESAYIIGAATEDGSRLETSNFGATVDYNVVAESTSEATAKFTGYLSKNGAEVIPDMLEKNWMYLPDYLGDSTEEDIVISDVEDGVSSDEITVQLPDGYMLASGFGKKNENIEDRLLDTSTTSIKLNKSDKLIIFGNYNMGCHWYWLDDGTQVYCIEALKRGPDPKTYVISEIRDHRDNLTKMMYYGKGGPGYDTNSPIFQTIKGVDGGIDDYFLTHFIASYIFDGAPEPYYLSGTLQLIGHNVNTPSGRKPLAKIVYEAYQELVKMPPAPEGAKCAIFQGELAGNPISNTQKMGFFMWEYKPPAKGGLSVWKHTGNRDITDNNSNYSLVGAEFNVYKEDGTFVQTIRTNRTEWYEGWEYGVAATADDALDEGRYYVQETKASPGYTVNGEKAYVTVVAGQDARANYTYFSEPPKTGEGELEKKSDNPAMTDGNNCYSLAGAVYGVWKDSSCSGEPFKKMTTDENGHAKVDKLPFGNYWVKEITPSKGFELDTNVYPISVTEANPKATIRSVEPAGNDPAAIEVTKIWNGPETPTIPPLAGTQFTVCYYDGFFTKDNLPDYDSYQSKAKRKWVIELRWEEDIQKWFAQLLDKYLVSGSDPLYKDTETNTVILPYGTYVFLETKSAEGYETEGVLKDENGNVVGKTNEPYVTQVNKDSGAIELHGGHKYKGENEPKPNKIRIRKVDENGNPLAGAKFTLMNSKGEIVSTKTSGSDGYVVWEDLYPDRYTVTEIKTKNGKNLLKDPIVIELPMRITEEDIKKYNIDRSKLSGLDKEEQKYFLFDVEYEISNHATFEAPMTGGFTDFMTFLPLVGGMAGFAGVGVVVTMKRKRKKK